MSISTKPPPSRVVTRNDMEVPWESTSNFLQGHSAIYNIPHVQCQYKPSKTNILNSMGCNFWPVSLSLFRLNRIYLFGLVDIWSFNIFCTFVLVRIYVVVVWFFSLCSVSTKRLDKLPYMIHNKWWGMLKYSTCWLFLISCVIVERWAITIRWESNY